MAFKVWLGDREPQDCGDDDAYDFLVGGVLALHYAEPGRWSEYYPRGAWKRISAAPNHQPGGAVDQSIGPDFD
ncbi:MAG TPA: hypothetical protein VLU24_06325 [Mycobacterium sp.]|nr:hypothetical protein [Mycobacterium sp.]